MTTAPMPILSAIRTMTDWLHIQITPELGWHYGKSVPLLAQCFTSNSFSYLRVIRLGQLRSSNDYNLSVIPAGA